MDESTPGVMETWRRQVRRRQQSGECPCPECLPYPNERVASQWNAKSKAAGWTDIGEPVPVGWVFENGWGLARTNYEWSW